METYISIVHSLSGRHTGVIIMSDDQMFIRESAKLVGAIREVYGGDGVERPKSDGRRARNAAVDAR